MIKHIAAVSDRFASIGNLYKDYIIITTMVTGTILQNTSLVV